MKIPRRVVPICLALVLGVGAAGCEPRPTVSAPVAPPLTWTEIRLPTPAAGEHLAVRAATRCGNHWYASGAILGPADASRPAVWTSTDLTSWTPLPIDAKTYYGEKDTIYTIACHDNALAAVGSKTGGVHGNPRVSTWRLDPNGALVENLAYFEVYGGSEQVSTSRIVGTPEAWLIAGNRRVGAAVWVSTDSVDFKLLEGVPGLASDAQWQSFATDAVVTPWGWMVVGGATPANSINRDPSAWISADTRTWRRIVVAGTDQYEEIDRAALLGDAVIGVGIQGNEFGVWRGNDAQWAQIGHFGVSSGPGYGSVAELSVAGKRLFADVSNATTFTVWRSDDGGSAWQQVNLPASAPARYGTAAVTVADAGNLLVFIDDGTATRAWRAALPATG